MISNGDDTQCTHISNSFGYFEAINLTKKLLQTYFFSKFLFARDQHRWNSFNRIGNRNSFTPNYCEKFGEFQNCLTSAPIFLNAKCKPFPLQIFAKFLLSEEINKTGGEILYLNSTPFNFYKNYPTHLLYQIHSYPCNLLSIKFHSHFKILLIAYKNFNNPPASYFSISMS